MAASQDSDITKKVIATTAGGKEIMLSQGPSGIRVKFRMGGELPPSLSGRFTGFPEAINAIKLYVDTDKRVNKANGKSRTKS